MVFRCSLRCDMFGRSVTMTGAWLPGCHSPLLDDYSTTQFTAFLLSFFPFFNRYYIFWILFYRFSISHYINTFIIVDNMYIWVIRYILISFIKNADCQKNYGNNENIIVCILMTFLIINLLLYWLILNSLILTGIYYTT